MQVIASIAPLVANLSTVLATFLFNIHNSWNPFMFFIPQVFGVKFNEKNPDEFPPPGMEIILGLQGSDYQGLLGLEILNHWIITFNGLDRFFKIMRPEA